jgi:hypothetical protein
MDNKQIFENWKTFFINKGINNEYQEAYLSFIDKLLSKNIPIIFEIVHLSLLLGRTTKYLFSVSFSPESHYREFKMKKRSGGFRTIDVPYPALLECQYWIFENILSKVKLNYCAHGFAKKKSIITNAKVHLNQPELLKIDLENFFQSISKDRVIAFFHRLGYSTEVSFYLASICCLNECLPQGAPTSPALSNIISIKLDNRLLAFAKKFDLKYTRYADDLAFSGEKLPIKFIDYITKIVEDEGLRVNKAKTKLYNRKGKRILTGVSISTDKIKAPKEYKKKLFQELYYINKHGLNSHMTKKKIRFPYYINSLIGKLNYVLSIEPENKKAKDYKKQLIEEIEKVYIQNNVS